MSERRRRDSRRGSSILELALCIPLLVLLSGGVFTYGYSFLVYHGLQQAVRGGARYGSVADFDGPGGTDYLAAVRNVTVYGKVSPDQQDEPILPGLTLDHVEILVLVDSTGLPLEIRVAIVNYSLDAVWQTMRFNDKPRSTFPYQGQLI